MLRIPCPYCGVRDQTEFLFSGEAAVTRPADPAALNDSEWADYLFYRNNLKGLQLELWVHRYGCGQWFRLLRDTATHKILRAAKLGDGLDPQLDPELDPSTQRSAAGGQ